MGESLAGFYGLTLDAPALDAPALDAPTLEAPTLEAPILETPTLRLKNQTQESTSGIFVPLLLIPQLLKP